MAFVNFFLAMILNFQRKLLDSAKAIQNGGEFFSLEVFFWWHKVALWGTILDKLDLHKVCESIC